MKRIIMLSLALILAAGLVIAAGQPETEVFKLTLLNNGKGPFPEGYETGGYETPWDKVIGDFMEANPNIEVTVIMRDVTQGSLTADAMMAKGTPPDVWWDAAGYFPKYMVPEYALPLEQYIDVTKWQADIVALYTKDGHTYALPAMNVVAAMVVNLDMLKGIGYTMPAQPGWTIDEFTILSGKLKSVDIPATMIMTKGGLIGWMLPWMYAFGAELYSNMDHSKVAINSPEGVQALNYLKYLDAEGYGYPHPNERTDDDGVELFTTAKVFSCMMQNGHVDGWVPEQVKQGKLEKAFEYDFVEFPHVATLEHTPVAGYQSVAVAHKSDSEAKNKAIAKLVEVSVGPQLQEYVAMAGGGFPSYVGLDLPAKGALAKTSTRNLMKLASSAGIMDLGSLEPTAREVNRAWVLPIQEFMEGKISAAEVLERFEAEANAIIAAK